MYNLKKLELECKTEGTSNYRTVEICELGELKS